MAENLFEIFKKIKIILTEPSKFFTNLEKEKGIKKAFIYYLLLSLFSTIMSIIFLLIFKSFNITSNIIISKLFMPSALGLSILFIIIGYFFGLLLSFVGAGILHVWILIFGGKADYTKTYQLYAYSKTPHFLIGWIPFISLVGMIYSLVLVIIGTQKVHKISRTRAILMYIIPFVIFIVLSIAILGIVLFFFMKNPGLLQNLPNSPIS